MRGLFSVLYLAIAVLACALLGGCAGKVPPNGPGALNIAQFTLAQGAINVPYKQLLVASGGLQPYTWSISSGSLPPGLTVSSDGIISGTPSANASQYPSNACMQTGSSSFPITCNFAAQVVDSQLPTHAIDTMGLSITINLDLSLSAVSLSSATVGVAYTATIMAANGVPPYTYAVASGSLPDGLTLTTAMPMNGMANAATISGTPTTAGVYSFTVQATDSASPGAERATATFSLTVVGILNGPYAISFNGFDTNQHEGQAFYLVGSFTPSGDRNGMGSVSGMIDQTGSSPTASGGTAVTGTFNFPLGTNFGTISFTRTDNGESYTFDVALSGTSSDSKMIQVDPNHKKWGSGLLKKQASTTIPSGVSYTFGSFGTDAAGNRFAAAGAFALGPSLAVTGGAEDNNDNGTLSGEQCITGGSFSGPDPSTGRGTVTLMVAPLAGGSCGMATTNSYAYYVAGSGELIAVETDSAGPMTLVDLVQQQAAGISGGLVLCKSGSKCQGAVELDGIAMSGSSKVPEVELGVASFSSCTGTPCMGNFMRSDTLPPYYVDQSVGGTVGSISYTSGTYSIDSSCGPMYSSPCGRVTINLHGPTHQPVWYLSTTSQGFIVGGDADVLRGSLQPQSPPTGGFSLPNLLGSYLGGTITPSLSSITNEIDVAGTPPPGGTWSQNYETSGPGGSETGLNLTGPYNIDPTYGAGFGRFAICAPMTTEYCMGSSQFMFNPDNPPIEIVYIAGGAQVGATGGKAGLVGINLGLLQSNGTARIDDHPRLTTFGR